LQTFIDKSPVNEEGKSPDGKGPPGKDAQANAGTPTDTNAAVQGNETREESGQEAAE
jgi:hypothetical protein